MKVINFMKKFSALVLGLGLTLGVVSAVDSNSAHEVDAVDPSYVIEFVKGDSDSGNGAPQISDSGAVYASISSSSKAYKRTNGMHLSSGSAAGNATITLTDAGKINASKVVINALGKANKSFNVEIRYTDSTKTSKSFTPGTTSVDNEVETDSNKTLKEFYFSAQSSTGIGIASISVFGVSGGTETGGGGTETGGGGTETGGDSNNCLIIEGDALNLPTAVSSDEQSTEYEGITYKYLSAKKQAVQTGATNSFSSNNTMLVGKLGAYIYNSTRYSSKITKFEVYYNKGATTKGKFSIQFSDNAISSFNASDQHVYTKGTGSSDGIIADAVYDASEALTSNCKYFWYQATADQNTQVQFRITFAPPCTHTSKAHYEADAAGCEKTGNSEYYVCQECGKIFNASSEEINEIPTIQALGHSYVHYDQVNPQVGVAGTAEHYVCSVCSKIFDANKVETTADALVLPALTHVHEHVWDSKWTVDENSHWHVCLGGDNCIENDQEGAHIFGEWSVKTPATYFADGVEHQVCSVCGYEATRKITQLVDYIDHVTVSGSMSKTEYGKGDSWDTTGLVVSKFMASAPETPVTVTDGITWRHDPEKATEMGESITVHSYATVGGVESIEPATTTGIVVTEKKYESGIEDGAQYIIEATFKPGTDNEVGPFVLPVGTYTSKGTAVGVSGTGESFVNDVTKAWTFTSTGNEDEWYIHYTDQDNNENYLYLINDNNGVRCDDFDTASGNFCKFKATLVGTTKLVLTLNDNENTVRYLTAYSTPDFRCYTSKTSQGTGSCDIKLTKYVAPHVHSMQHFDGVAPTCLDKGNSEYWYCAGCGKYFSDAEGTTEITENSWIESIDALKHHMVAGETIAPTCTEGGYTVYSCDHEGCTHSEHGDIKAALGHDYVPSVSDATCTTAGNTTYTCSRCGDSYQVSGEPLGHEYEIVSDTSTCTTAGIITYRCSRCGDEYTKPGVALGHNFVKGETVAPTCTEDGYTIYSCDNEGCTAVEHRDVISKLGHDYQIISDTSTCEEAGIITKECSHCHDQITEAGAALGHDFSVQGETVAPTFETKGYTVYKCSHEGCDEEIHGDITPVLTYATVYSSNVTLTKEGGENASNAKVKIGEIEYDAIKAGTSSKSGSIVVSIPENTSVLHFHAIGWSGSGTISLDVNETSYTVNKDSGISGNSPYILSNECQPSVNDYYTFETNGATSVTFESSARFVIFGVNAEIAENTAMADEIKDIVIDETGAAELPIEGATASLANVAISGGKAMVTPTNVGNDEKVLFSLTPEEGKVLNKITVDVDGKYTVFYKTTADGDWIPVEKESSFGPVLRTMAAHEAEGAKTVTLPEGAIEVQVRSTGTDAVELRTLEAKAVVNVSNDLGFFFENGTITKGQLHFDVDAEFEQGSYGFIYDASGEFDFELITSLQDIEDAKDGFGIKAVSNKSSVTVGVAQPNLDKDIQIAFYYTDASGNFIISEVVKTSFANEATKHVFDAVKMVEGDATEAETTLLNYVAAYLQSR